MFYQEYQPGPPLRQYVKCYYLYESDSAVAFDDTVLPSGHMEIIFNLGDGQWQTAPDSDFLTHPAIELWGQIVRPLPVRSIGRNSMLGIRLFPQAAPFFLSDKADLFTNQVVDYSQAADHAVRQLHQRLLDTTVRQQRIQLVEDYLRARLTRFERKFNKLSIVNDVMREIGSRDFFDNLDNVAARYGITARYLQKLFLQYTGLTPKLYSKINRFQHSLRLVNEQRFSLTSIAYDCGYFDQSHFIREFKSFTGYAPSLYPNGMSPITQALSGLN
ncbi:helix-turn-helix transcriptional regulator [Paraflavitalea pollutisoli]|uniref:helix-turn-helix transcriptional regulator n=1 Tax=Paraflavitalea pollutisoli TaxID=3034143 RepID=UPI0030B8A43C